MEKSKFIPCTWGCLACDSIFYMNEEEYQESAMLTCPKCGYSCATVQCPNCDNIDLCEDFASHPSSWVCEKCNTEVSFPEDFYTNTIHLYDKDSLPIEAKEYLAKEKSKFRNQIIIIIIFLACCFGYIIWYSMTHR